MKLSDPYNTSDLRSRSVAVAFLFGFFLFILLARLWYLQIWRGAEYRVFSDRNRFKIERLSAPRGSLYDRNGHLIADSRARYDLSLIRANIPNIDFEMGLLKDIFRWTEKEFAMRLDKLKKSSRYHPVIVAEDLTHDQLALIESRNLELEGVDIQTNSVRDYLYKEAFFHVIGYTREIDDDDLKTYQRRFPERQYRRGDQIGVKGVEALYEPILRGKDGSDFTVVDVKGRRVDEEQWRLLPKTSRIDPTAGLGLMTSLDLDLQLETAKALEGLEGSAIALDPNNGEVLAFVSSPALNPNLFSGVIAGDTLAAWMERDDKPFLDRVLGEHYAPGSTFKIVTAIAALEQGVIDERTTYFCPGWYRFGNRVWKCHAKEGHGRVNIVQALERSCDVFFYNTGLSLGLEPVFQWANRFGFGRRSFLGHEVFKEKVESLFRFNSEQTGFLPNAEWVISRGRSSVEAEILNASIGQGAVTATAMQLARMTAALVSGGKIYQPQLVRSKVNTDKKVLESFRGVLETSIKITPKNLELVLKGIEQVVNGAQGTARASRIPGLEFGGKTGTAQVAALELSKRLKFKHLEDHALFVGAAPLHQPKIVVAVIVENGGQGSRAAAPIGKRMVSAYLKKDIEANLKEKSDAR